jgi:hypothetical protein
VDLGCCAIEIVYYMVGFGHLGRVTVICYILMPVNKKKTELSGGVTYAESFCYFIHIVISCKRLKIQNFFWGVDP